MALWLRMRVRDDSGISLVEIMVSIVILGIALTAFAGTITSVLGNITQDEQFVRGNQVAADLVEESRAQAWDCIGLDSTAPGWTTTGAQGPMVEMDSGCTAQEVNLPEHAVTIDVQDYDVTREVAWVDDSAVPGATNYKRITVTLDWSVRGRDYTAGQESVRVPTPDEVPVASLSGTPTPTPTPTPTSCAGQIQSMTITPSSVAITPSGLTDEAIVVVATTCAGTTGVTLGGETAADSLSTRSMVATPAGSTTRWELSFPRGTPNFDEGVKTWRASASGNTVTQQITFYQQTTLPPVVITAVTPTPGNAWCVFDNGGSKDALRETVTLAVAVTGLTDGSSGTVSVRWTTAAGSTTASFNSTTGTWRATIPSTARFTGTTTTVYVTATRTVDNAQAAESATTVTINRVKSNVVACPAR